MSDMTKGRITPHMLRFLAPMVAGNILQQFYNAAASIIVGRHGGDIAFAAIGVASPIMNLVIFIIVGMCTGASVLMSERYGSQQYDILKLEFSSSLIGGSFATIILSVIAVIMIHPILHLTGTPNELVPYAWRYLAIIFSGLIFTFFYNICSSAFYSIGDSRSPLLFLAVSSVINIILTSLFVIRFQMGIAGAAWATVISQAVSVMLSISYIACKVELLTLNRREWKIDWTILSKTAKFGIVTATQISAIYLGKLFIQGAVNPLGINSIAAFNAATRVDAFLLAPSDSMNNMVATFTAQNSGANQPSRIKRGLITGIAIALVCNVIAAIVMLIFPTSLSKAFLGSGSAEAIGLSVSYLKSIALFYIFCGTASCFQGFFRGNGKIKTTLIGSVTHILLRVILTWFMVPHFGIQSIAFATGIGWIVVQAFLMLSYRTYAPYIRDTIS